MRTAVDTFLVCDDEQDPEASSWLTSVEHIVDEHGVDYLVITQKGQSEEPDLIVMDRKDFLRIAEILKGQ
jgi:hypothetical protein